jgi:hypothetical protein
MAAEGGYLAVMLALLVMCAAQLAFGSFNPFISFGSRHMVSPRHIRIAREGLMAAAFVAAVWLPLSDNLLKWDPTPEQQERRDLAARPGLPRTLRQVKGAPAQFEKFYGDRFGLRKSFLSIHGLTILAGLAESPKVLVGKDGWLYARYALLQYDGEDTLPESRMEEWRKLVEQRHDWLRARGVRYLLVIAPNKASIYPEYLPTDIRRGMNRSEIDCFLDYMRARSDVDILDLRPALLEAKERDRVFCKTDVHWNGRGAFAASQAVAGHLSRAFPDVAPLDESGVERTEEWRSRVLADMLGVRGLLNEEFLNVKLNGLPDPEKTSSAVLHGEVAWQPNQYPFALTMEDARLPKAVVFRDSYCIQLAPFLARHFRRSVYYWQLEFAADVVEHERPDIVIDEVVERHMINRLKPENNPPELVTDALP